MQNAVQNGSRSSVTRVKGGNRPKENKSEFPLERGRIDPIRGMSARRTIAPIYATASAVFRGSNRTTDRQCRQRSVQLQGQRGTSWCAPSPIAKVQIRQARALRFTVKQRNPARAAQPIAWLHPHSRKQDQPDQS